LGVQPGGNISEAGRKIWHEHQAALKPTTEDPEMAQPRTRSRFLWLLNNTLNRATSQIARSGRGPFSLIRHVGRKSGATYETPVILARVPEGFIAELTYGENVNWYRNILAAGGCVILHHRVEYRVTAIEPCAAQRGRTAYRAPFSLILKVAGRDQFRLLRTDDRTVRPARPAESAPSGSCQH
jgi:deazaflavin-dependent oxidoreductase (nitroreductase family)